MQPPYFDDAPPTSGDFPLPKRPANCRVYERMCIDGVLFRSPIGRGWSKEPIRHLVICETVLGVIEIVNLPHVSGDGLPASVLDDNTGMPLPHSKKRKHSETADYYPFPSPLS